MTDSPPWKRRLAANLAFQRERIGRALESAGRLGDEVRLVAVTKHVPIPVARGLIELGVQDLGENRVDSLVQKAQALEDLHPRWHFIGHLQRNKVQRVLPHFSALHSVDSSELLNVLAKAGAAPTLELYLQVKWTDEARKTGLHPREVPAVAARADELGLSIAGLMSMGVHGDPEETARIFRSTEALARELEAARAKGPLRRSMGMSGDLEMAIEHGADVVRIGTALFEGIDLQAFEPEEADLR